MRVKELIKILEQCNPEAVVLSDTQNDLQYEIRFIEPRAIFFEEQSGFGQAYSLDDMTEDDMTDEELNEMYDGPGIPAVILD